MNLTTTYLGFALPHPFMPGASPLVDDLDMVRRLEDAGAAAIVMHSLFEEQVVAEVHGDHRAESFVEALCYFRPVRSSRLARIAISSKSGASARPSRCRSSRR